MTYREKPRSTSLPDPRTELKKAEQLFRSFIDLEVAKWANFKAKLHANPSQKGYAPWRQTLGHLCVLSKVKEDPRTWWTDRTVSETGVAATLALAEDSPVRFLSREITESFLRTKVTGVKMPPMAFEHLLINVPTGMLKDDDGAPIVVIHVSKLSKFREAAKAQGLPVGGDFDGLHIAATSSYGASFNRVLDEANIGKGTGVTEAPEGTDESALCDCLDALERIAIHTLMVMAYKPELITTQRTQEAGRGFGARGGSDKNRSVVWIGKDFKRSCTNRQSSAQGAGGSKAPHWRAGHWHTVKHGKGRQLSRIDWFEPVYVNGEVAA